MLTVPLNERSYAIEIGSGNLARAGTLLTSSGQAELRRAVLLTDENVAKLGYAHTVTESIAAAGIEAALFVIGAGETGKSLETAATLWETLVEEGADRKTLFVAVGGGVIGDVGGFVAATYARGIRFFQVPTTLLAQVDSSVGGKVAVNLPNAKNMVGVFHQPIGVLIDTTTLETLDPVQFACGLGEVVKYGVSLDAHFFEYLEAHAAAVLNHDRDVLREIVFRCCRIKADIVAQDERETTGRRALLNFGHTFAHALETASEYGIPHGLAVSIGNVAAARLAESLGRVDATFVRRLIELNRKLGLPIACSELANLASFDPAMLLELMRHDKKAESGRLHFILPTQIGGCEPVADLDPDRVLAVLRNL